jgi:hypothetical protein
MKVCPLKVCLAMFAMTDGVSWGSLRIDDENGKLISGLRQVLSVVGVRGNARDDSMGSGWGSLRIDKASD